MLFATVGMMVMVSASNLMTLYLGLELQSLALYVLAAFARDDLRSSEAGLKYFVLGALASGLLLYGISLVYGFSGTMDFDRLAGAAERSGAGVAGPDRRHRVHPGRAGVQDLGRAVPHVDAGRLRGRADAGHRCFFATAPKVAAMALLVRVMATPFGHLLAQWQQLIVLVSIASMLLGAFAAIGQRNIKRLMAYSSIGHMGYALIGLAAGTADGVRGVLVYLIDLRVHERRHLRLHPGDAPARRMLVEQIADLSGLARTRSGAGAGVRRVHVQHGRHPAVRRASSANSSSSWRPCRAGCGRWR